jgi:hypothetical protein
LNCQFALWYVLVVEDCIRSFDVCTPKVSSLEASLLPPLSHLRSFHVPPLRVVRSEQLHGQLLLLDTSPPRNVFGPRLAVPLDHLA